MYCSKCGKENEETASFCGSCGNPLKAVKTHEKVNLYFVLIVISNVFALIFPIIPIMSVYSWYDNRDHSYNLIKYLLNSENLKDQMRALVKAFHSYDEHLLTTIFSWLFLVSVCFFSVISILFAITFFYKIAMGNRSKGMLHASARTMGTIIITVICVIVYSILHTEEISINYGMVIILISAILNITIFHKLYKKESELKLNNSDVHDKAVFLKVISVLLIIVILGLGLAIYCKYQISKATLYSKQSGWDLDGEWAYNEKMMHIDRKGNVVYEEGGEWYKGAFFTSYLIALDVTSDGYVWISIYDEKLDSILDERVPISENGVTVNFIDVREGAFSVKYKYEMQLCITPQRVYIQDGSTGYEYERHEPQWGFCPKCGSVVLNKAEPCSNCGY